MKSVKISKSDISQCNDGTTVIITPNSEITNSLYKNISQVIGTDFGDVHLDNISVGEDGKISFANLDPEKTKSFFANKIDTSTEGVISVNIPACSC
jgi:hypothetical protein